jgi:hypothetical protein
MREEPSHNQLKDRHHLKAVINQNMGGSMGKKLVLK